MLFLYTFVLLLVGVAHFLTKRRVVGLAKKYEKVVKDADTLIRQSNFREGNSNRQDPYLSAKRQYQLALLAQKRDQMEDRYSRWQSRAERLSKFRTRLRSWQGRKLPYTFGVLDVTAALALVDYLGAGQYLSAQQVVHALTSLFTH
jgi:hypothetical protein